MGSSVVLGGLSTFLGVLPLVFSSSEIMTTVFYGFVSMVLLGCSHGLILLPVLLSLFGPLETVGTKKIAVTNSEATERTSPSLSSPSSSEKESVDGENPTTSTGALSDFYVVSTLEKEQLTQFSRNAAQVESRSLLLVNIGSGYADEVRVKSPAVCESVDMSPEIGSDSFPSRGLANGCVLFGLDSHSHDPRLSKYESTRNTECPPCEMGDAVESVEDRAIGIPSVLAEAGITEQLDTNSKDMQDDYADAARPPPDNALTSVAFSERLSEDGLGDLVEDMEDESRRVHDVDNQNEVSATDDVCLSDIPQFASENCETAQCPASETDQLNGNQFSSNVSNLAENESELDDPDAVRSSDDQCGPLETENKDREEKTDVVGSAGEIGKPTTLSQVENDREEKSPVACKIDAAGHEPPTKPTPENDEKKDDHECSDAADVLLQLPSTNSSSTATELDDNHKHNGETLEIQQDEDPGFNECEDDNNNCASIDAFDMDNDDYKAQADDEESDGSEGSQASEAANDKDNAIIQREDSPVTVAQEALDISLLAFGEETPESASRSSEQGTDDGNPTENEVNSDMTQLDDDCL